ncbi:MAG: BON domain-containing protein [Armatimonadetes bacterium]|nr:BON domain-containing protein [Armatimonadota bacterium]
MKQNKAIFAVAVSTFVLLGGILTGCGDTADGVAKDTTENTAAVGEGVAKTGEAAMETGEKAAEATGKAVENTGEAIGGAGKMAGEAVGGVAKGVGNIAEAATLTPAIKSAIIASKIDGSTVNVDTEAEADTIVLNGTVKSAAEKTQAGQIAAKEVKEIGKTYKIKNNLTVAP